MTFLLSNWRLVLIAALIASNGLLWALWRHSVESFDNYKIAVIAEGERAKQEAEAINKLHQKTLEDVSNAWAKQLPKIREGAVTAFLNRYPLGLRPATNQGCLPGNAESPQIVNGTREESVSCPSEFIRDCAEDAGKVGAWQEWARLNKLGIE